MNKILLAAALILSYPLGCEPEKSIVPKKAQIDDFEARLTLARILSHDKKTRGRAVKQYLRLLREKQDLELNIELGRLYVEMKQFKEGLTLLYNALEKHPENIKLLSATAFGEVAAGHPVNARRLFLKALCLSKEKGSILIEYADAMMTWGDFYKAEEIYRQALTKETRQFKDLSLKLAWSLASQGRYEEAEGVLLEFPRDKIILEKLDALNRLANKFLKDDQPVEEIEDFQCRTPTVQELEKRASIYLQEGMAANALLDYEAILRIDPHYFPAQVALAETYSVFYRHEEALEIYEALLQEFPLNYKLMLAIARVHAWSKEYDLSIAHYDEMIALNPNNPVLYREKARTALWGNEFILAMQTYNELLCPAGEDFSRQLIQKSIVLEKNAKKLFWNKRYRKSLNAYYDLLEFNPGNEEALFDFGQNYCVLGLCDRSKGVYEHILYMDPNHSLVKFALRRNAMKTLPQLSANFSYWREIGAGSFSQSQIARYRLDEVLEVSLSCRSHFRFIQQEYVENPFFNFKFYPAEGQAIEGDYLINENVSCFVSACYKNYFNKFDSVFTSYNRLLWTVNDYLQILLSCNRENEIYNFFSLQQATQSITSYITLSSNITHSWNVSGTCQYYVYNDHNSQIWGNLTTEYQFFEDPNAFKVIFQGNYRNAASQSVSIVAGENLVDMIHPYWTPDKYISASLALKLRHDYRKFEFCEAPQRYIDFKITGEIDNAENPSIQGLIEWKHEWNYHLGLEIKALLHRSPQWNAEGVWATLNYRF